MAEQDTLTRILGEIKARRDELRPYADELPILQAAAQALNNHSPLPAGTRPAVRGRRGRPPKASATPANTTVGKRQTQTPAVPARRAAGSRKRKGANQKAVVRILRRQATPEKPLSARQVADSAGLDPSIVHGVLGALTKQGVTQIVPQPSGRSKKSYTLANAG